MKRRKRLLQAHGAGCRRPRVIDIGHGPRGLRSLLTLAGALVCVAVLQPRLVNPTTQIQSHESNQSTQGVNHFDDEPNFQREFASLRRLTSVAHNRSAATPATAADAAPSTSKMISNPQMAPVLPMVKAADELEQPDGSRVHDDNNDQHLGDLLAVESSRSPAALGLGRLGQRDQQSAIVAPYETTSGQLPRFQNLSSFLKHKEGGKNESSNLGPVSSSQSSGDRTQLLRIQAHAPLEPIYLKHSLPDTAQAPLKRQIVAFPHPSHASTGNPTNGQPVGSYALLPSWPNIYIAQRERISSQPQLATQSVPLQQVAVQDPKVPMNYPEWSRARQIERENATGKSVVTQAEQRIDRGLEVSQPDRLASQSRRSNLTASEVEYEGEHQGESNSKQEGGFSSKKTPGHNFLSIDNSNNTNDDNNNNNTKATASADSAQWARLLHQAAASQPIKPLMFTNRSIVSLFCDTHDMLVSLKFKQPFYGSVETNLDPLRPCRLFGNGSHFYEMRIGLLECGTRQEMPRLFINNIQIQFRSNNSKQQQQQQQQEEASRGRPTSTGQLHLRELIEAQEVPEELKTLICSYPPPQPLDGLRPRMPATFLSNNLNSPQTPSSVSLSRPHSIAFGNRGQDDPRRFNLTATGADDADQLGPALRPSDKIIDVTNIDDPNATRPIYYEPILLISGLLLLAMACTLALISSAYLARRHQRRTARTSAKQAPVATMGSQHIDPAGQHKGGQAYHISPSQLANRSGGSPLAPPLIGLTKEELLTKRPAAKKYSSATQKDLARVKPTASGSKRSSSMRPANGVHEKRSRLESAPARSASHSDTTSDSLESGAKRSQTGSASTIEIPLVSHAADLKQTGRYASRRSEPKARVEQSKPTSVPRGPPVEKKPTREPEAAVNTTEEYRREVSHVRLVEEKTDYRKSVAPEPPARDETHKPARGLAETSKVPSQNQQQQQQQRQPPKSQSPLPFGSLRSKLTSPIEYKRLQNISKLFGDSLTPNQDELHLRYRNRIARTMSDRERLDLRKLFQHDEVFRSYVVDSVDVETFRRKLRDNPKYSGRFSPAAWALLQEIMLNPDMSRPPERQGAPRPGSTRLDEIFASSPTGRTSHRPEDRQHRAQTSSGASASHGKAASQGQPQATNLDEPELWLTAPDKLKEPAAREVETRSALRQAAQDDRRGPADLTRQTQKAAQTAALESPGDKRRTQTKMVSEAEHSTTAVSISQSNSTRHTQRDGSTRINIDSVTNISAPRDYSAFTRSSLEQVTRYQEEDSLPFMDEFSQGSIGDSRSFSSSSSLENNHKTNSPQHHVGGPAQKPRR